MTTKTDSRFQHVLSTDEYALYYKGAWGRTADHDGMTESTIVRTPFSTRIEEVLDLIPQNEEFQIAVFLEDDVAAHLASIQIPSKKGFSADKAFAEIYKATGYMPPRIDKGEKLAFCSECDSQILPSETVAGWDTCGKCEKRDHVE